jgi:hypothetical protein
MRQLMRELQLLLKALIVNAYHAQNAMWIEFLIFFYQTFLSLKIGYVVKNSHNFSISLLSVINLNFLQLNITQLEFELDVLTMSVKTKLNIGNLKIKISRHIHNKRRRVIPYSTYIHALELLKEKQNKIQK